MPLMRKRGTSFARGQRHSGDQGPIGASPMAHGDPGPRRDTKNEFFQGWKSLSNGFTKAMAGKELAIMFGSIYTDFVTPKQFFLMALAALVSGLAFA